MLGVSLARLKRQMQRRLRSVVYETQPTIAYDAEFGALSPLEDKTFWGQMWESMRYTEGYWSALLSYWTLKWMARKNSRTNKVNIRVV